MLTPQTSDILIYLTLLLLITVDFWPFIQKWRNEEH